jgi:hypothetical protein
MEEGGGLENLPTDLTVVREAGSLAAEYLRYFLLLS